jgi:hypothetical protein
MKTVSGVLRLLCGLGLIIFAFVTYHRIGAQVASGQEIQIAGVKLGASVGQLDIGLVVVGLVGIFLIVLGALTLMKKKEK